METQIQTLADRLSDHGWAIVERDAPTYWWVTEIWTLESEWRPRAVKVFLSCLVDPMSSSPSAVWAVAASLARPIDQHHQWAAMLSLGHNWRNELEPFLSKIDALRDSAPTQS